MSFRWNYEGWFLQFLQKITQRKTVNLMKQLNISMTQVYVILSLWTE